MKLLSSILVAVTLFSATTAFAAPADDAFNRGLSEARSGHWSAARDHFLAAQRAGMDRAALHYNLGVAYYRLGNYPQASQSFRHAAKDPRMAPLAHYNLGLVALKEGHTSVAKEKFTLVRRTSDDPRLRALADEQLAQIRTRTADDRWRINIAANAGYDDGIVDPLSQTTTTEGSRLMELLAAAKGPVSGNRDEGWLMEGSVYLVRYPDQDAYDSNVLRLGLSRAARHGGWATELGAQLEHSTLGEDDYLQWVHVAARGDTPDLTLLYRLSLISALDAAYDPLAGTRHQARADKQWFNDTITLRLGYRFEYNDREDLRSGATFTSYSPIRHELRGGIILAAGERTDVYLDVGYRTSRYLDPNRLSGGSRVTREDRRIEAGVTLSHQINTRLSLDAGYLHTDNDSNLSTYDYDQNLYTMGVSATF